jgi:hypothetical protein
MAQYDDDDGKSVKSSMCSMASQMTVSAFGGTLTFEEAQDKVFKDLQAFVNQTHCNIRELTMIPEQDGDYIRAFELTCQIAYDIKGMHRLFAELIKVSKQICGPCPKDPEIKAEVEKIKERFKRKEAEDKEQAKRDRVAEKEAMAKFKAEEAKEGR